MKQTWKQNVIQSLSKTGLPRQLQLLLKVSFFTLWCYEMKNTLYITSSFTRNPSTDSPLLRTSHYGDVIMSAIASQITSLTIVYSTVYSDADQRKHQSSASLAFVRGIHRGPVNSPHKWPATRKTFPFDDVIMNVKLFRFPCCQLEEAVEQSSCPVKPYDIKIFFIIGSGNG